MSMWGSMQKYKGDQSYYPITTPLSSTYIQIDRGGQDKQCLNENFFSKLWGFPARGRQSLKIRSIDFDK